MGIIDTHCHLYSEEFGSETHIMIKRAQEAGVTKFYMPAIDSTTHRQMIDIEEKYPGICFSMMGLHPCSVKADNNFEMEQINEWLSQRKFAAIGEIGLDFHWDTTYSKQQYEVFEAQINLAVKWDLPIILHTRNAIQETINVVKNFGKQPLRGIFHCFGGTIAEAEQIVDLGFALGIGGVLTYKNAGLAETLMNIDINHLVLETDAPYLAPVPYRGKRNESSYLPYVVQKLANVKHLSPDEIIEQTSKNATALFACKEN